MDEYLAKRMCEKKNEASELARQKAAQAWCTPETERTVMDPVLAEAFTKTLDEIWSQPWLGNATTKELLEEISARIEIDGKLDYRTVDEPVRLVRKNEVEKDGLLEFEGKTSVLPMFISKGELKPATEVIVCSAISGGAKYMGNMPKELTLVRKLLGGKEYTARYEIKKSKGK